MTRFTSLVLAISMMATAAAPLARANSDDDLLAQVLKKQQEVGVKKAELAALETALNQATEDLAKAERSYKNWNIVYGVSTVGLYALAGLSIRSGNRSDFVTAYFKILAGLGIGVGTTVAAPTFFYLNYRSLQKVERALDAAKTQVEAAQRALDEQYVQLCSMLKTLGRACQ